MTREISSLDQEPEKKTEGGSLFGPPSMIVFACLFAPLLFVVCCALLFVVLSTAKIKPGQTSFSILIDKIGLKVCPLCCLFVCL